MYKFTRALGIGFCLYLATFVVGIICAVISGQDMASMENIPDYYWYIGMVAGAILAWLFAGWYFKSGTVTPSAGSGFLFGLTAVVLSAALDYVLFTFGSPEGQEVDLAAYYGDYRYWIIIALVVLAATIVGKTKTPQTQGPAL
jgi:hypothetical protein